MSVELDAVVEELRAVLADQVTSAPRVLADVQALLARQADASGRALALAQRAAELAGQTTNVASAPIPVGANTVRVGGASYPLAAVNPVRGPGRDFPGGRGQDELVAYRPPVARTGTNQHGAEVDVRGGRAVRNPVVGVAGGLDVPADGYVLSGHGRAATFLSAVGAGVSVEVLHVDQSVSVPPVVVTPRPAGRTLAMYLMDGVGHIGQIPGNVTQIRVAFLQGSSLVEWGGDTPAQTAADLTEWRAARPGRQVLISVGGQGGSVNLGALVKAFSDIETKTPAIPLDGIDWDIEGGALDIGTAVAVSKALAAARPGTWVTAFTPPGGDPVAVYLEAARQCQAAGLRVQFSQQLYDTAIDQAAVIRQTKLAAAAVGPENVLVGCMVGDNPAKYSTVAQWETYVGAAVGQWRTLGGAMLWESSRGGTAEWARRVGAVLGL